MFGFANESPRWKRTKSKGYKYSTQQQQNDCELHIPDVSYVATIYKFPTVNLLCNRFDEHFFHPYHFADTI